MNPTMEASCPTMRCSFGVDFICAQFGAWLRILLEGETALKSGAPLTIWTLEGWTCGPALPPSEAEHSARCH